MTMAKGMENFVVFPTNYIQFFFSFRSRPPHLPISHTLHTLGGYIRQRSIIDDFIGKFFRSNSSLLLKVFSFLFRS